jgi:beta-fructofuranosidase
VFRLASSWVWDFWLADDGATYHLFFLKASRALIDPDRRHRRATIGHATSADLVHWEEQADALVPGDEPAFDDLATWTGSVVRNDGGWRMFYTGVSRQGGGLHQRIGMAASSDLFVWEKPSPPLVLGPDPRWYETLEQQTWFDEAWRDPWVFQAEDGWHMLVTARARDGDPRERGVVGHAVSDDLVQWEVLPPLSGPDTGFGQLEVLQLAEVDGRRVLLFSCGGGTLGAERPAVGRDGGVWAVNAPDSGVGPFDLASAYRLTDESLYVGRLIQDREGAPVLLAFRNLGPDGTFIGELTDPLPLGWAGERLVLRAGAEGMPPEARDSPASSLLR